ncbi:MAG: glycosyltransferase family 4 protein [Desulfobacteraceae bacterium]|nr:glycosyltransferase family 4 protein [Desulfobacteraceae bacterium]MDD3991998.1 glycosyltransferase family 4 protein [Desulfobacteraceae bacterium]
MKQPRTKLRIAVLVKRFICTGGAERYAVEITRRMVDRGHSVDLYARVADAGLTEGLIYHRVPSKYAFSSVLNSLHFASETARMIHKEQGGYDIIHSHEKGWIQDLMTIHTFSWKGSMLGHTLTARHLRAILSPRSLLYLWLEKKQMRTPWLVPVSEVIKTDIDSNFNPKIEMNTIVPGVDVDWFNPSWVKKYRKKRRTEEGLRDHEIVVLFVGSEFRRKGLDFVIRAIGPGMRLLVVGAGERMRHYRKLVHEQRMASQVHFKGLVADIRAFYAVADIVVLPSVSEAFGMTILEAMACGLCVVVTQNSGVSALIQHGKNGFVLTHPSQMGETLSELAHSDLRHHIGSKARDTAEQYTWDRAADQYERLYYRIGGARFRIR